MRGLATNPGNVVNSGGAGIKAVDGANATTELTVETWLFPANSNQFGPTYIVALSNNTLPGGGNAVLGQVTGSSDVPYDAAINLD